MACTICGGETADWVDMPLDAKKDVVTPFRTAIRCRRCETGTIEPKPRPDEIPPLYVLPAYYTHGASHMVPVTPTVFDRVLVKLAWWMDRARPFDPAAVSRRIGPSARVLDIGCGGGEMLAEFKALGHEVTGVDPDADARRNAAGRGVDVLAGTGEDLPPELPAAAFDLVVMSHSLEHCLDPPRALASALSRLKPGGFLYIEVPNCGCIHFTTMLACSENFDSPRHLWFFTERSLTALLANAGLTPVEWRYHGLTRHHSPDWRGWESTIAARLGRHGFAGGRRHGLLRSALMLVREMIARPLGKYDAMGILAQA